MVVATMAPVSPAGPRAVTHCPTTKAAAEAGIVSLNVVDVAKVTFDVVVTSLGLVVVVFDLLLLDVFPLAGAVNFGVVPTTTKTSPEIDVTLPKAMPPNAPAPRPAAPAPLGNVPVGGRKLPDPPEPAAPPAPRNSAPPPTPPAPKPAPPPPKPLQVPDAPGWLIEIVVAFIGAFFDFVFAFDDAADPVAVTQSPTARVEAGTVTVWLKVVVGLQLTVT